MMRTLSACGVAAACVVLAACGGGGDSSGDSTLSPDARKQAAEETVAQNPDCAESKLGPYYWEIGDGNGAIVSGQVGSSAPSSSTPLSLASASKWLYAAYAVEKLGDSLDATDVAFLNFTSGFRDLPLVCPDSTPTVGECSAQLVALDPDAVGKFYYDGGHMERHAALDRMGLGSMDTAELGATIGQGLGIQLAYGSPTLAAGGVTTPAEYAVFLRKILNGDLRIASMLADDSVCASVEACPTEALNSPQSTLVWHYGLGHWIEDDIDTVAQGNVAYSSAGALGFYPWVNADRTLYGILARETMGAGQQGFESALCGAAVRRAYVTGQVQSGG